MRLITHNMLQCHIKDCNSNNFPLELFEVVTEIQETDFSPQFIRNMLPKLDWDALVKTALQVSNGYLMGWMDGWMKRVVLIF